MWTSSPVSARQMRMVLSAPADAMYAPVCTRFRTYSVPLEPQLQAYCETIFDWPLMQEWTEGARAEPDEIIELEVEF